MNGCWHTEENELKASVVRASYNLFSKEEGSIDRLSFEGLDSSEVEKLKLTFLEEEVFVALFNLDKDKAPSLDGYTMTFWFFVGML